MSHPREPRPLAAGLVALLAALTTLSPFAIDTYLPALGAVREGLAASALEVQQSLAAYMFGLAAMALWHGAISDALGRRPVMIGAVATFTLASLVCALAPNVQVLIAARFVQGLAGGAGMILTRAIVRDLLEGAAAQRLLARVMMMFGIAPAIAPIIGGWLYAWSGWRAIFWFLCVGGVGLTLWAVRALPESLPRRERRSLHPVALARSYFSVFRSPAFHALTLTVGFSFQGFLQYVGAAHPFLVDRLSLAETQFAYLFVPAVIGFVAGSWIAGRVAGRWRPRRTVNVAFTIMFVAALFNVLYHAWLSPNVVASIAPIMVGAAGIALASPIVQLLVIDAFPATRGLAASCQAFVQLLLGAFCLAVVALPLSASVLALAGGQLAWVALGFFAWLLYLLAARSRRK